MRSVNKVILIGNLTRDPELKMTQSGQAVCTLGIATNRDWVDKNGEKRSLTEFHEVTAWAKLGELCNQLLKKGNLVYFEGYLKTRSWDDPATGKKSYRTEIVVDDMIKLERRTGEEGFVPVANTISEADHGSAGADALAAFAAPTPADPTIQ